MSHLVFQFRPPLSDPSAEVGWGGGDVAQRRRLILAVIANRAISPASAAQTLIGSNLAEALQAKEVLAASPEG